MLIRQTLVIEIECITNRYETYIIMFNRELSRVFKNYLEINENSGKKARTFFLNDLFKIDAKH